MKVLFVSSGNSDYGISPIIKNQGESLKNMIEIDYFTIKGKGVSAYLSSILKLRHHLRKTNYDIIHAHYSFSAFVASLAGAKPLVVSLMGSDVVYKGFYRNCIVFFYKYFWVKTIVKSEEMKTSLGLKNVLVIPNGVDFKRFKPMSKDVGLNETKWDSSKKHVLFAANPARPEKNYKLAKKAFDLIGNNKLELHSLKNIPNKKMPFYINASDVILLTSLREGSPNVIKEAMACNMPIVATDVGDIRKVAVKTKGCFITEFKEEEVANNLLKALDFGRKTTGRQDIGRLRSDKIAAKIVEMYNSVIKKNL